MSSLIQLAMVTYNISTPIQLINMQFHSTLLYNNCVTYPLTYAQQAKLIVEKCVLMILTQLVETHASKSRSNLGSSPYMLQVCESIC